MLDIECAYEQRLLTGGGDEGSAWRTCQEEWTQEHTPRGGIHLDLNRATFLKKNDMMILLFFGQVPMKLTVFLSFSIR